MGEFLHFVDQDTMPSEQRRGGGKEKTASSVLSASITGTVMPSNAAERSGTHADVVR